MWRKVSPCGKFCRKKMADNSNLGKVSRSSYSFAYARAVNISCYYMEESGLLGTKPLVDSIRHFIRDPSGVFSVCHLCECRIVQ